MTIFVTKRNGEREALDLDKIHKVINWGAEGLNVSVSQVELKANPHFVDGIKTSDIHKTLVKSAADLITEWEPDYSLLAARLAVFDLRKRAFGQYTPPDLYQHVEQLVSKGIYDKHIIEDYTASEITELGEHIDHDRDLSFHYAAVKQWEGKYLVQDRTNGTIYESPQQAYMLIAMCLFASEPKDKRMDYVKRFYDAVSLHKLSLPTPIMAGVRTPTRQFSSCTLIESGDSIDSINATAASIVKYVSQRAGIGVNAGSIRAIGSPIRNGEAFHTGCIPFYKHFQTAVKSCSQGGVRNGAATLFYPLWHFEAESLLVLKNNRGTDENRVRHMDYGVQLNKLMYQRLVKGGNITLFSPHDVKGLYDAFFADQDEFERLYIQAENDPSIRKKTIKAVDLFSSLMSERASTGRIYIQNVDHCNTHSPFDPDVAPVRQSNLCVAPNTLLEIKGMGLFEIQDLVGQEVEVWNGVEWSLVCPQKTGVNQKLMRVHVKDVITGEMASLSCTPYHKWYDHSGLEKRAFQLNIGDTLLPWVDKNGKQKVQQVFALSEEDDDDTYCFTEEKRNMAVFNGILTGQCLEIALPTKPLNDINDTEGEIALCTLSAFNLGAIGIDELHELSELIVRALDNLLDYQDYPIKAAEIAAKQRRTLGIGVTNFAYFLAKNNVKYSDGSANNLTHRWFEAIQYSLLKASNGIAKEKGACGLFGDTRYSLGVAPHDTSKPEVDALHSEPLHKDWDSLMFDIAKDGLRNSTLTAIMPCETSSQITNSTNGIEPPRGYVSVKLSKDGILKQVVPDFAEMFDKYELLWDIPNNKGYLDLVAIMQKFVDQSISANTNYDPARFENGKVPMKLLLSDLLTSYKNGVKTLYYHNTRDGQGNEDDGCESGACKL